MTTEKFQLFAQRNPEQLFVHGDELSSQQPMGIGYNFNRLVYVGALLQGQQ